MRDPFTGHWTLNPAESRFTVPPPAEWTQDIKVTADGLRTHERMVGADGTVSEYSVEARFDGAEYPVTGSPLVETMAYARPEPNRIDGVGRKAGAVVFREVAMADGETLTMAIAIPRPDGSTAEAIVVFRRTDSGPSA